MIEIPIKFIVSGHSCHIWGIIAIKVCILADPAAITAE